jgi:hypothetical protein
MLADRLQPVGRRFHQPLDVALHIPFAGTAHLYINYVARHGLRHEKYLAVDMGKAVALGGHGLYEDVLKQRFFSFSCHL